MKEITTRVTSLSNGNEVTSPSALVNHEISATAQGRTWESARNKSLKEIRKELEAIKEKYGYFEAVVDICGADEAEQNAERNHFIQSLSISF
jgi:NADH:ubiquinone oxidoreductase subunit C